MKFSIIKYSIVLAFVYSCNTSVNILVNQDYCGKVFIVLDSNILHSPVHVDSNGIGYLNSMLFNNDTDFKILRSNEDITNLCNSHTSSIITTNDYEYEFLTFIIPCSNEINEDSRYWEDKESFPKSETEFENLIKDGKIKINGQ